MADPTSLTLLGAAIGTGVYATKKGVDVLADLVGALLKPSAENAGEALRNYVQKRRERATAVVVEAGELLDKGGFTPVPVPGRVLFPLLEAASHEEDTALHKMWVGLLASAGDKDTASDISPAFVSILSQLSPTEALLLKALYFDTPETPRVDYSADGSGARFNPRTLVLLPAGAEEEPVRLTMPFNNFRVLADNLARLGLIEIQIASPGLGEHYAWIEYTTLTLSPLGHHFIQTCERYPHHAHLSTGSDLDE